MLKLYSSKYVPIPKKKGQWIVNFPKPTIVGKTQKLQLILRNESNKDQYEIQRLSAADPDLTVKTAGRKNLYPKDEVVIFFSFNPKLSRREPLEKALFRVDVDHIMVTSI